MEEKAPLKLEDFDGLTVPQFKAKLKETTSIEFLSALEEREKSKNDRTTVLDAINKLQGELIDNVEEVDPSEDGDAAPVDEPESQEDVQGLLDKKEEDIRKELSEITNVEALYSDLHDLGNGPEFDRIRKCYGDRISEVLGHNKAAVPGEELPIPAAPVDAEENGDIKRKTKPPYEYLTEEEIESYKNEAAKEYTEEGIHRLYNLEAQGKNRVQVFEILEQRLLDIYNLKVENSRKSLRAELVDSIKEARLDLDRIYGYAQSHLSVGPNCESPLFKAKSWLGKMLGAVGEDNPYHVEGGIKNPKDIPATTEKNDSTDFIIKCRRFSDKNSIPAIEELRKDLDVIAEKVDRDFEIDFDGYTRKAHICRTQAWINICEAKFELGRDLSSLRK